MEKKTKILYIITKSNWGGAQKYVHELAVNLPKNSFEVVAVMGGNGLLAEKLSTAGVRVITLSDLKRDIGITKEISSFFSILKIYQREKPDIVHLNSPKAGGLGALAGRIAGVPKIIYTAHGFAHNEDRSILVKAILYLLEYLTILLSHQTIVISQRDKRQMEYLPFTAKKLKLIQLGIKRADIISIAKDNSSPITIGTISELTKNKGLEYLLAAILLVKERGRNINLIIIGEGEEREGLEKLAHHYNLEDVVQFLGFRENASAYLGLFDIFILTSVKEGMPYTILEAGLAGLPVVASDVGGVGEIIKDGVNGLLVRPKDVQGISTALETLIDDAEQRASLGKKLQAEVEQRFPLKKMFDETKKLYR